VLERLAGANGEKVKIVKVDANANRSWAGSQNVRGVPTFQFYQGGMLVHQFVGAYPESEIQKKIDQYAMVLASTGGGEEGAPVEPAIRPMPKEWLPPGVSRK